jgi:penicillin-binding protein-related factor A (putative recombinase)
MKENKKKLNPQKRGAEFQNIIRDSLVYYEAQRAIVPNFWDRPQKHIASNKKLISDFWYVPMSTRNLSLLEAKVVNSRTSFSMSRVEDHQLINLYNVLRYDVGNGHLVVHFKYGKEDYGAFAIDGETLMYDKDSGIKSYKLSDIVKWANTRSRAGFFKIPFRKVLFGEDSVKILELERIF